MYIIQEYECKDCERGFELLVKRSEINHERCPDCKQLLDTVISAPMGLVRGTRTPVSYIKKK